MSQLCDATTGLCIPEETVAYASPTGSNTATCTPADPCAIQRAFAITDASRSIVRLAAGSYTASIVVTNKSVEVRGIGATVSATTGDTLTVNDRGKLRIVGAVVVGSNAGGGYAITCRSLNNIDVPEIALENVQVEGLYGGAYFLKCKASILTSTIHVTGASTALAAVQGSQVDVVRSRVLGGAYTVTSADNSIVKLANCVVGNPTSGSDGFFAIGGGIAVSFSTILNATAACNSMAASCNGASTNGVCFDNSIIANYAAGAPSNTVTGQGCIANYTLSFPQANAIPGAGNKNGVNPNLTNPAAGDLHLQSGSPAIDAANPASTLSTDFDGKSRPQGAQRDLGAFEYP